MTPKLLLVIVLQASWASCLCFMTLRAGLGSSAFVILAVLTLVYALATALLAQKRRLGWQLSFSLSLMTSALFLLWVLGSLVAYWGGSFLYKDSPASIIAAMVVGVFGLLPSMIQAILLWTTRGYAFRTRKQRVRFVK